jgi:hypothetical protein
MTVEIKLNGKVTHRSRNLRGLLTHAHRAGVMRATVQKSGTATAIGHSSNLAINRAAL